MPVWGAAFRNLNPDQELEKLKVHNLAVYIESIQQKEAMSISQRT